MLPWPELDDKALKRLRAGDGPWSCDVVALETAQECGKG
jgi:hypothetical protein